MCSETMNWLKKFWIFVDVLANNPFGRSSKSNYANFDCLKDESTLYERCLIFGDSIKTLYDSRKIYPDNLKNQS